MPAACRRVTRPRGGLDADLEVGLCVPSTGGKTVLIQNLILNVYRNSFARIFIFSPSVHNDPSFTEVKKYIRDELHVDDEKGQIYFDNYNPSDLENVIERQKKIIHYMKSKE